MRGSLSEYEMRTGVTRIEVLTAIVVSMVAAWLIVPALARSRARADRETCLSNLTEIGRAVESYLTANQQRWPYVSKLRSYKLHDPPWPTLPEVLAPFLGESPAVFRCPTDNRELPGDDPLAKRFARVTSYHETEGLSYAWYWGEARGGRKIGEESLSDAKGFGLGRADQVVLRDFEPFHVGDGGGTFNSLFADFRARPTRAGAAD